MSDAQSLDIETASNFNQPQNLASPGYRTEKDFLGEKQIPADALFGVQTSRAKDNFNLSGKSLAEFPEFIRALAMVKKACARANCQLQKLDVSVAADISAACDKVIDGQANEAFILDMIQGGAGTSTNMNINEVIANLVAIAHGEKPGCHHYCHPNNHVNLSQSTNDVYPTAIRLALLLQWPDIDTALSELTRALRAKAKDFSQILKIGRTQLQDAVPMSLGQEFAAFADFLAAEQSELTAARESLRQINLGGTAIGTGINAPKSFCHEVAAKLSQISGESLWPATNLMSANYDTGAFLRVSSAFKNLAVKLSKVANDLRLLSMGPRAGLAEITLPAMQPGSSIMPGKVNPVIPEAVSQVAFQVIGFDHANTMAAEAGQLQLNAMEPLLAFNLFQTLNLLTRTMHMFRQLCIEKIEANPNRCHELMNQSIGLITALNPYIGYENSSRIARTALEKNQPVASLVLEEGLLSESELSSILDPHNML